MKVIVTFRHMEVDEDVRAYVEEKTSRLAEKYFKRPQEGQVVLTAEKFRRLAEISIKADNVTLVGKEETQDLRNSIDMALDKLDKQAAKHRKKIKDRKKGGDGGFVVYRGPEGEPAKEGFEPEVIRDDRFVPKPMSIEDAILLLEDGSDDFLVFVNQDSMVVCVLYRRPDGHYGLIEPSM